MIKVGFDISQIAHGGGVATYTANLAKRLNDQSDLQMIYFYASLRKPYQGNLKVLSYPIPPTLLELLFNKIRRPSVDSLIGPTDIFHSSDWTQPKTSAKKVTTYHDVIPLKFPQWSDPRIVAVHKRRLKLVEKEVDMVIAVSQATKKDLLEISRIPEEKIAVIYEGVSTEFKPQPESEVERFRHQYHLPKEFVLAIGGVGERRNLERIKEAVGDHDLVIAGQNLPYLPAEEMPLLYCAAKVLLYPSLSEGFGLPVVEAFACGAPVITSDVSSMAEVGGGAALYVNPEDVNDIKSKLKMVLEDNQLRLELIKKGFSRAKKFSWEKAARETAEVYRGLMK